MVTVCWHMATNVFQSCKSFPTAFAWTHPLPLARVPQQMSLQFTGRCERPATARRGARVRTFTGVHAFVLPKPTDVIKTSSAAVELTLQRFTADVVLSCMWHQVPLECKRLTTAGIRTTATHANQTSNTTHANQTSNTIVSVDNKQSQPKIWDATSVTYKERALLWQIYYQTNLVLLIYLKVH